MIEKIVKADTCRLEYLSSTNLLVKGATHVAGEY